MTQFRHALVRQPSPAYAAHYAPKGIAISNGQMAEQHARYVDALKHAGLAVEVSPSHPTHHDCVFIEDTAVLFSGHALITRMNPVRQGEQRDVEPWLAERFTIHHLPNDAQLEGGDILHLDDQTLVGVSARTNAAGVEGLRTFLHRLGHEVLAIPVTRCLHLKSAITFLGDKTILTAKSLIDLPILPGYAILETAVDEPHAGNVLRINDRLICSGAFPKTNHKLRRFAEARELELIELDISEAQKGDGALTCQSILW